MDRFIRYLESRGIKRVKKDNEAVIEDLYTPDEEESSNEIFDFLSLERIGDADLFYHQRRESFNTEVINFDESLDDGDDTDGIDGIEGEVDMTDGRNGIQFDLYEYTHTTQRPLINPHSEILQASYNQLTIHHDKSLRDIDNPNYTTLETDNPSQLVKLPPANKFTDALSLHHLGNEKLVNHEYVRKYKNNLSTVVKTMDNKEYLVNASNSEILVYEFNLNFLPNPEPILKFDTKPIFTTTTDRLISTWPYFPHTINYIKFITWLDQPSLAICIDDGGLMIYYLQSLIDGLDKYKNKSLGLKINPDFKLKLESSLWGVDFLHYVDDNHTHHNLILTSDNSQSLTLFYYHLADERFYHVKSHQILHNIPDVSIINYEIDASNYHIIKTSCVSISGELIIFKFKFKIFQGPLNKCNPENIQTNIYYVDPSIQQLESSFDIEMNRFKRIQWVQPIVINRVLLTEDCWTSTPIDQSFFKTVHSLSHVFGDNIDELELIRIYNESLLFENIDSIHNDLGICKKWQYFQTPVLHLGESNVGKLTTIDDDYRRINKSYNKWRRSAGTGTSTYPNSNTMNSDNSNDTFLLVSTSRKLGLFNASSLFCNCSTPQIFNLDIPCNEESKFSNRISITHVIPQLSCVLAVTQQGLISIFRLCQYRGIVGMRQEFIFPHAIALSLGYNGYRTICGLSIRDITPEPNLPRFLIYITYTDGLILTYELKDQIVDLP